MIAVVDYGVNNLTSVVRALAAGGHRATLTADPAEVGRAERVVVPGVGNFGRASENLRTSGLGAAIQDAARMGRPVMGICLGLQLFLSESEEAPGVAGLGLIPGRVERFRTELPVPHVGWAEVHLSPAGARHAMLAPLFTAGDPFYYHVHSFHPAGLGEAAVLATGDYGGSFPTIAGQDNVIGVQFHPEKSQRAGIELLSRFVAWRP